MIWGASIAWYLFLAGAAAGAFFTSALVETKYPDNRTIRLAGRIIAPVFVTIGLILLMVDAEAGFKNPLRFIHLLANPGSVMTLGVYVLSIFMVVSYAAAILELMKKKLPVWLKWIGVISAFGVAIYTGFLLGVVKTYPLWNNSLLPILFTASAFSSGLAATSLVGLLCDRKDFEHMWLIKKSHVVLVSLEAVLLATMLIITSYASYEGAQSVAMMISGKYAVEFWLGIAIFGLLLPFIIEGVPVFITKRIETSTFTLVVSVIGEGGVIVGGFLLRYIIIMAVVPVVFV